MVAPKKDGESAPLESKGRTQSAPADDSDDERHLWAGSYSGRAMLGSWLLALAASAAVFAAMAEANWAAGAAAAAAAVWLIPLGALWLRKLSVHYELTTQRFLHRTGILVRRTDWIELIDIDDIAVLQSIIQRLVGVGEVRLSSLRSLASRIDVERHRRRAAGKRLDRQGETRGATAAGRCTLSPFSWRPSSGRICQIAATISFRSALD